MPFRGIGRSSTWLTIAVFLSVAFGLEWPPVIGWVGSTTPYPREFPGSTKKEYRALAVR